MKGEIGAGPFDAPELGSSAESKQQNFRVAREEIVRLLALHYQDPPSILGIHPTDRGVIIRACRSDAEDLFFLLN